MAAPIKTFDPALPVKWMLDVIDTATQNALLGVASKLIVGLAQVGTVALGIYMILLTYNYMRGAESEPLMDFFTKLISWAAIIGYGLNADSYTEFVLPIVTGTGNDLANYLVGGASNTTMSPMDTLLINVLGTISQGFSAASQPDAPWYSALKLGGLIDTVMVGLKAIILIIGVLPFVVVAVSFNILANMGSQILASLAPIFFFCLLFPLTRSYFNSWLNSVISYALIPVLIAIVTMIASGVSIEIMGLTPVVKGVTPTLVEVPLDRVIVAGLANMVFVFLLHQVASMASALSSGGINAGMASAGSAMKSAAKGVTGTVREQAREVKGVRDANHARLSSRRESQNKKNQIKGG